MSADYYDILGVNRNASDEEIKKAWKTLAMRYHPDRQAGKSPAEKADAEKHMKEINEAYSVLSDPDKRRQYDVQGSYPNPNIGFETEGLGIDELLNMFMNARRTDRTEFNFSSGFSPFDVLNRSRQRRSVASLDIPLQLAVNGGKMHVSFDGDDFDIDIPKHMPGRGVTIRVPHRGYRNGDGVRDDLEISLGIIVPANVNIDGDNLVTGIDIPFDVAICGGKVAAVLPSGTKVNLKIPSGTQCGKVFAIPGEGLGRFGRCLLKANITVPRKPSAELKAAIKKAMEAEDHIRG